MLTFCHLRYDVIACYRYYRATPSLTKTTAEELMSCDALTVSFQDAHKLSKPTVF